MEKKYVYEVPVVEIIEVEVEKGFATSGQPNSEDMGASTGGF